MAGYLFNLSPTKKTGTGQDVLEKHEEKERGTCVYCVHLYIVCLCYVPESVCIHACICIAMIDGNELESLCYLS